MAGRRQRIVFLIYDGFEILDLSGPMAVFTSANTLAAKQPASKKPVSSQPEGRPSYEVISASSGGGLVPSSSGVSVTSVSLQGLRFNQHDTVLVVGGHQRPIRNAARDSVLLGGLRRASNKADRYGSICSGAFLVGAAGLLSGRRCTTHWMGVDSLADQFGDAVVDRESLYVTDGRLWTSAGATTGIDMALSMLRADHGTELMGRVAKWLVVNAHRPGHQSQFSLMLKVQTAGEGEFASLVHWITDLLDQPIKVSDMAEHVLMTERTFYRRFTAEVGVTPAKFLETLRLQRAKELLELGLAVKVVPKQVGFRSEAAFRSLFKSRFGVTPSMHALIFQDAVPTP